MGRCVEKGGGQVEKGGERGSQKGSRRRRAILLGGRPLRMKRGQIHICLTFTSHWMKCFEKSRKGSLGIKAFWERPISPQTILQPDISGYISAVARTSPTDKTGNPGLEDIRSKQFAMRRHFLKVPRTSCLLLVVKRYLRVGDKDAERKLAKVWQVWTLANFRFRFLGAPWKMCSCANAQMLLSSPRA